MTRVIVAGAGLAGLLAANMLGGDLDFIAEKQEALPNNHSAVLRFRTSHVSDVLNIPFRKVKMLKATEPWRNPVADALAYSFKTSGTSLIRSSASATGEIEERFIAPPDLIRRMANKLPVHRMSFGIDILPIISSGKKQSIISTIPMPKLMSMLMYPYPESGFKNQTGYTISFEIEDCDAHCSLYIPDPSSRIWRISITGNWCMIETDEYVTFEDRYHLVKEGLDFLGMEYDRIIGEPVMKLNTYAKILPIDETERKRFIIWASENYNVYSFGRFATWRPGLLMDDLVNDFRVIMRLIDGGTKYDAMRKG